MNIPCSHTKKNLWSLGFWHRTFRRGAERRGGYAALTAVLMILFSSLAAIAGLTFFSLQEAANTRASIKAIDARAIADAGMEDALYRIASGKQMPAAETLGAGKGTTTITITTAGTTRTIRSAARYEGARQNMEAALDIRVTNVGFHFGVQAGNGGLAMSQNSSVSGSVFSNGPISGNNGAVITGDALAAGASTITDVSVSGDAAAHQIERSTVGGHASSTAKLDDVIVGKDAHANELRETTVNQNAYFNVIDKKSVVLGSRITPSAPPADVTPLPMPIATSTIDQWKNDAAGGGTISGDYILTADADLGAKEITGNMLLNTNNKVLTVTGTLYVHGYIDISNGSAIRCAAFYATTSCMILSDSWMHIKNNGAFSGSGQTGSFLMLLSTLACDGSSSASPCDAAHHHGAIDLHNNSTGAIFYATRGLLTTHNGVGITEATAYKFFLDNNAAVTYETGLASVDFSSGPTGGYGVRYWKQVP